MTKTLTAAEKKKKAAEVEKAKKNPLLGDEGEVGSKEEESSTPEVEEEKAAEVETFDPVEKKKKETVSKVLTESEKHLSDIERFKLEIAKYPKTNFIIPLDPGEKVGAVQVVSLNGLSYTIKKGAMVEIPIPIAEILAEKYEIEMTAGKEMLADRDETHDGSSVISALE